MAGEAFDEPQIAGTYQQEKEFYIRKIVEAFPERAYDPNLIYGNPKLEYLRLINEGIISAGDGASSSQIETAVGVALGKAPQLPQIRTVPGSIAVLIDSNGRHTQFEIEEETGDFPDRAISRWQERMQINAPVRSSLLGSSSTKKMYDAPLSSILPIPVYPLCIPGIRAEHNAAMLGANMFSTAATFTIPSTATAVDVILPSTVQHQANVAFNATIGGIHGVFKAKAGSGWQFTRNLPGKSVIIREGEYIVPTAGPIQRYGLGIHNLGKNNSVSRTGTNFALQNIELCWNYWRGPKVMVGHFNNVTYTPGSNEAGFVAEINQKMLSLCGPELYFDQQACLNSDEFFANMGITPTTADREAIAKNVIPPSLDSGDGIHLSNAAYLNLNLFLKDFLVKLGYTY